MANRSSTSSSDPASPRAGREASLRRTRRAWAAWALALIALVGFDRWVLGPYGPWGAIQQRIDRSHHRFEWGITDDRLSIQRLRAAPPEQRRVVVAGSSQARVGFDPEALTESLPTEVTFGEIAHGGFGIFDMRSMVGELLGADAEAVVLFLSPLDVNSRLRILPQASFASFSAVWDLAQTTGPAFVFENRRMFLRLLMANLLNSYRYRQVLDSAWVGRWRHAGLDRQMDNERLVVRGGTRKDLSRGEKAELTSRLIEQFPHQKPAVIEFCFRRIYNLTRGDHGRIHRQLARRTVELLTREGVRIVVVEAPLHPLASEIYDLAIRDDFLSFIASLEQDFAVHFVPLESSGPFVAEDFWDPIHVSPQGARKLTQATVSAVGRVLDSL